MLSEGVSARVGFISQRLGFKFLHEVKHRLEGQVAPSLGHSVALVVSNHDRNKSLRVQ